MYEQVQSVRNKITCLFLIVCGILNITLNLFIVEGEVRPVFTCKLIHLAHVQFEYETPVVYYVLKLLRTVF